MSGGRSVIVIGAGLAGLCCARTIQRAGHTAHLYEASDGVGGRVRTDFVEGFRLDRGFQVLFTAYPAIRQELDLDALHLRAFDPGAQIYWNGRAHPLTDPLRRPSEALATAASPLFGWSDKLRVPRLVAAVRGQSVAEIFAMPDRTMETYLREFGFSAAFLDRFIRPFYGGIFLERDLQTSARMFAFVFKMLAEGQTALPEQGMGAMGRQIADDLAPDTLHLNAPARELIRRNGRVTGVTLEDGQTVQGDAVVVATEADNAARLTGQAIPVTWRVSTELSYALAERPTRAKAILLFADANAFLNNATVISNVAPSYAPSGQHLLTATVLGDPNLDDSELDRRTRAELAPVFPAARTETWTLLRVTRVPWAQFAQTVGAYDRRVRQQTDTPGLILAGEYTETSSLHGALVSGQRAAGLALSVKNRTGRELAPT